MHGAAPRGLKRFPEMHLALPRPVPCAQMCLVLLGLPDRKTFGPRSVVRRLPPAAQLRPASQVAQTPADAFWGSQICVCACVCVSQNEGPLQVVGFFLVSPWNHWRDMRGSVKFPAVDGPESGSLLGWGDVAVLGKQDILFGAWFKGKGNVGKEEWCGKR